AKESIDELGISEKEYLDIVEKGIMRMVLARKHGKVYCRKNTTPEEFVEELS
ncbi:MAG: hypothetical protein HC888_02610, partial [Candidatus Competibacteraceae bacterium]|nr:hypothetical protein [Candidatus Competibacteraceae bacterium]